jgi:hypothetical protein
VAGANAGALGLRLAAAASAPRDASHSLNYDTRAEHETTSVEC